MAGDPTYARLEAIRDILDNPSFLNRLEEETLRLVDAPRIDSLKGETRRLVRELQRKTLARDFQKNMIERIAINIGVGLSAAAIGSYLAEKAGPLLALAILAVGIFTLLLSYLAASKNSQEGLVHAQLAERANVLRERLQRLGSYLRSTRRQA